MSVPKQTSESNRSVQPGAAVVDAAHRATIRAQEAVGAVVVRTPRVAQPFGELSVADLKMNRSASSSFLLFYSGHTHALQSGAQVEGFTSISL